VVLVAQQTEVEEVVIRTGAAYLGGSTRSTVTVERVADGFARRTETQSQPASERRPEGVQTAPIDEGALLERGVRALVEALQRPMVSAPDFSALRIDAIKLGQDLRATIRDPKQARLLGFYDEPCPAETAWMSDRIAESIRDGSFERNLEAYFVKKSGPDGGMWTDDFPNVSVTVRFQDGTNLEATSSGQRPFMLPWKVMEGARTTSTYDVRLPIAIANLMPANATNRDRMSIAGFLRQWRTDESVRRLRTEWEEFLKNDPDSPLAPLMDEFLLERANLRDLRSCNDGGQPCGYDVAAAVTARPKGAPAALRISAYLRAPNGQLYQASAAVERLRFVRDRVYAIPWLMEILKTRDPNLYVELRHPYPTGFHRDWGRLPAPESFSRWHFDEFVKDMTFLRKGDLIDEVRAVQGQIVTLGSAGQDTLWLILPDDRVILWRYAPRSDLLAWKQTEIAIEACAESTVQYRRCAGAIISPDGKLTP
jgi:hypothetical protein